MIYAITRQKTIRVGNPKMRKTKSQLEYLFIHSIYGVVSERIDDNDIYLKPPKKQRLN